MSLLRKIAFSTLPSHLRRRGQLMAALFHAELALVSGPTYQRLLKSLHFVMKGVALSLFMLIF